MTTEREAARAGARAALIALAAALAPAGCEGDEPPRPMRVWGRVSLDGRPIGRGSILFTPTGTTAGASAGGPIRDGRYDIRADGGPLSGGSYRVEISAVRKTGQALPNAVDPGGPPLESAENYIPDAYNCRSTLRARISADPSKNQLDFALRTAPAPARE